MQTIDFLILILAIAGASFAMRAGAQGYPEQSVRLVVPFPPGGTVDLNGRIVANALTDEAGQTFVVDTAAAAARSAARSSPRRSLIAALGKSTPGRRRQARMTSGNPL